MIMLFLYRLLVFVVSALVHYCGLFALLWFGQIFVGVGASARFDIAEIGVISAVFQGTAFAILCIAFWLYVSKVLLSCAQVIYARKSFHC